MAVEKEFTNIGFSRLRDFVDFKLPETLDEISYVANATNFRRFILNKFGKDDLDVDQLIAVEEDTRLTYQGYRRFLMSDLRHIYTLGGKRTSNTYKRETKYLAKQMLVRGYVSRAEQKNLTTRFLILSSGNRLLREQLNRTSQIIYDFPFTSLPESTRFR